MAGVGSLLIARAAKRLKAHHPQVQVNLVTTSSHVDVAKREAAGQEGGEARRRALSIARSRRGGTIAFFTDPPRGDGRTSFSIGME
jgi:hypothetical protein